MKPRLPDRRELLLALTIDMALGEPPNALHPVAWLGTLVGALERQAPRDQPGRELLYGAAMTGAAMFAAALPGVMLERWKRQKLQTENQLSRSWVGNSWLSALSSAVVLKPAFAGRALFAAVAAVRRPLVAGDLGAARLALRSLVSRDPAALDAPLIAAAAIQSLAENASDSFVAPLFYYSLFGLPGAWVYRVVNTLDAMVGYHGRFEYLGKFPARLDDLLNIIPARLTGLLIVAAAGLTGADARQAWHALRRDHAQTESPNAGYPMSAIAGALGTGLEKIDHYHLHAAGRAPQPADIERAERVVALACLLFVCMLALRQRQDENT